MTTWLRGTIQLAIAVEKYRTHMEVLGFTSEEAGTIYAVWTELNPTRATEDCFRDIIRSASRCYSNLPNLSAWINYYLYGAYET